jgi:hypothetical protein
MQKKKTRTKYLVVYEDLWHNKESYLTTKIGNTIKQVIKDFDLVPEYEIDFEKYNSVDPYDMGTFGKGFYDISFNDDEEEYAGRIMIFVIG